MIIDLKQFFRNRDAKLDVDYSFNLENEEIDGVKPFTSPILVKGEIVSKTTSPELNLMLSYDYTAPCNRCMQDTTVKMSLKVRHALVKEDMEDEEDFYVKVGDTFDLDELLYQEVILNIPVKIICKTDCKGLCPICGSNLNEVTCNCITANVSSQFEGLKALLENN